MPNARRPGEPQHVMGLRSLKEDKAMDETFRSSWRGAVLPFILTAVVVGSALAFALS